jgi:hypothetical protein
MGIEVSYQRISPEKFADIQNNPELAKEFFNLGESSILSLWDMIQGNLLQNNKKRLEQLHQNEASIYEGSYDITKTRLSLEKEWQAINYLLTGEISSDEKSQAEPLLSQVVMGGTPTKFEATYGFVRYFAPNEVKEIFLALDLVSREDIRARFDLRGNRKIYAQDEWDEEEWEMLLSAINAIVCFFNIAATNDEVILISSN